jgi:hypothetical protein
MTDPAHVLFPNDVPTSAAPAAGAPGPAGAAGTGQGDAKPPALAAGDPQADAARSIFKNEPGADDAAARDVTDTFGSFAVSAFNDGDADRGRALQAAGTTLLEDVKAAGGLASDLAEALGYVREAANRFTPATEEENQAGMAKALDVLRAERTDHAALASDILAAHRLIIDMDKKTPGLIEQLELTGAGNDPRLIKAAIKEARRRGY